MCAKKKQKKKTGRRLAGWEPHEGHEHITAVNASSSKSAFGEFTKTSPSQYTYGWLPNRFLLEFTGQMFLTLSQLIKKMKSSQTYLTYLFPDDFFSYYTIISFFKRNINSLSLHISFFCHSRITFGHTVMRMIALYNFILLLHPSSSCPRWDCSVKMSKIYKIITIINVKVIIFQHLRELRSEC